MIITKLKDIKDILGYLEKSDSVFIVGCNSCAAQCQTGGEEDVERMSNLLKDSGKKVSGTVIPDETCHIPLVKKCLKDNDSDIQKADALLVMACGAGTQAVSTIVNKKTFPACDTLFLGDVQRIGNFTEYCSMCGECILGETGGICPVTRCPKGIMNGPCGGMHKGKCEESDEKDCVWVKIWERLQDLGCEEMMSKIRSPKDYSKKKKPGNLRLNRR
ncbi:MAG: methylenetetrahydrofolate reductase C-terminal domain-containing protein [Candidatus Theseobacter exili]|nr:methylenetetrahydrofolate reductase C-terminal domain-containing protein [Candidatus Theseobacter exili]